MTTFDDRGVPLSTDAARAMSFEEIRAAIVEVAVRVELVDRDDFLDDITQDDGSTEILSDLGVDLYSEFIQHLYPKHRLRDVPVDRWSSIEGVALVVFDIYQNGDGHAASDS
ncbi:hypothetical protein ACWH95_15150 [Microbacterium sp. NPDC055502]